MDFRTRVTIPKPNFLIDYSTPTMLFGSCFTENIGNKLQENKFAVKINPFGISYNPLSVSVVINRLLANINFDESDFVFHNNVYQSFLHHGSFSNPDKKMFRDNILESFDKAATFIRKTEIFFITFGTAYVYRLKSTGEVVANCHKFPPETFVRQRLTVDEIVNEWSLVLNAILAINPLAKFVFTVSPIRHWKDGAHENQISKSILHLATEKLREKFTESIFYFPAYEILLDELRDYRFFAEDMMHPSPVAVDYIWERFCETFFSGKTLEIVSEWQQINRSLHHRALNEQTENYRRFLTQTLQKLTLFQNNYSQIDCSREIEQLTEKINR